MLNAKYFGLVKCDTVQSSMCLPTIRSNLLTGSTNVG